jgi:hypothetical protein
MNFNTEKRAKELKAASKDADKIIAVVMDIALDYISNPKDCLNFIREVRKTYKKAAEQK